MLASHWRLIGVTSALVGVNLVRPFSAHAGTNRVYTSVRNEFELNSLLILPNPLLANFGILTDPKSKKVSEALSRLVPASEKPLSTVDVEVDEPGNAGLTQRYLISKLPTIVALEGGEPVSRFSPQNSDGEELEKEISAWIAEL